MALDVDVVADELEQEVIAAIDRYARLGVDPSSLLSRLWMAVTLIVLDQGRMDMDAMREILVEWESAE